MIENNNYKQGNVSSSNSNYAQKNSRRTIVIVLVVLGFLLGVILVTFALLSNRPTGLETQAALAARKEIPNAEAKEVIVADGFAIAYVYVPGDKSQLGAGQSTIFRVNQDGSMTYIASASYFSPIDLLNFGIPLETQAKLKETSLDNTKKELASSCDYEKNGPEATGFSGFDGTFNPDGWEIDPASLEGIIQTLDTFAQTNNTNKSYDNKIICIVTSKEGSDITVNKSTFVSTFKLKVTLITGGGEVSDADFTFTDGPVNSRTYTLGGKTITSD